MYRKKQLTSRLKIAQRQGIYAAGFGIQNVAAMAAVAAANGGTGGGGGGSVNQIAPFPLFGPCYPGSLCMSMLTTASSNSQPMVSSTTDVLPTTKSNALTETCTTSVLH